MSALVTLSCPGVFAAAEPKAEFFETKIRPLLAERCFKCHGPDKQESGLRLDSAERMRAGGSRGPAVEPGNARSLLVEAIGYLGEPKMPADGRLSDGEIALLTEWVMQGAAWPEYDLPTDAPVTEKRSPMEKKATHWAYQPLANVRPPEGANPSWPRNDVDRFILAGIERAGLSPAPEADRRTLIRRVTFDLTGLPPAPEDVENFVADTDPAAFDKIVERLLASPQYGERWARHWLDVVRYTDSFDSRASPQTDPVEIWRYRDWVVKAFNEDMPYDRFAAYQVAGDLIPSPDGSFNRDGLVATGMLAIGNWPQGDADKQKMVSDIVDDQVDIVTRGFLGMTLACARCHDHKFDPFTARDYYGLAGIFFSSSILPGPGAKTEGSPISHIPIASREELAGRKAAEDRIAALRAERETLLQDERAAWARAEAARTGAYMLAANGGAAPDSLHPGAAANWARFLDRAAASALHQVNADFQGLPGLYLRHDAADAPSAVANTTANEVKYATIKQPARSIAVHPSPAAGVGIGWTSPISGQATVECDISDADGNCGDGIRWTLVRKSSGTDTVIAEGVMPNAGKSEIGPAEAVSVKPGDRIVLTILPNAEYTCDTTAIAMRVRTDAGAAWDTSTEVLDRFAEGNPWPDAAGHAGVWWLHDGQLPPAPDPVLFAPWRAALEEVAAGRRGEEALAEAAALVQAGVDRALADSASPLAPAVAGLLGDKGPFWLEAPPLAEGGRRAALEAEFGALEETIGRPLDLAVGIQEGGVPGTEHDGIHDVHIHRRGDYNNLGELVPRYLPAVLSTATPRPVTEGSGRRELGEWLTNECAPAAARVMANRVWLHYFGEGLVRTPGDFGVQGEAPTHPELLDYLAKEFIASGWSVKALHRAILGSATYRQSAAGNAGGLERDPENRHFARMNRKRLEAEALRDSALFASGRLDLTSGGPAFIDMNIPRRTLYLRTNRSNLGTYTILFDGADPTAIVPKRVESVVAPQALFLMNHESILNEAHALAASLGDESTGIDGLIDRMYRRLYARPPDPAEIALAKEALPMLGYPGKAALTAYAQVLIGANEFAFVD